jgi:hypothetical protein
LEPLEDRTLLSADFSQLGGIFSNLSGDVTREFDTINALPFVGRALDQYNPLSGPLGQIANAVSGQTDASGVQAALQNLFSQGSIAIGPVTITATNIQANPTSDQTGVTFQIQLHAIAANFRVPQFNLGLGNVFSVASTPFNVQVSFDYLLQVTSDNGTIQLGSGNLSTVDSNLPATPFAINITVSPQTVNGRLIPALPDFTARLFGLLYASASDMGTSNVGLHVGMDLDPSSGVTNAVVKGNVTADLLLNLQLDPSFDNGQLPFNPKLDSEFHLNWNFSSVDAGAPGGSFGNLTRLSFENIRLELGDLFPHFLDPVLEGVHGLTQPLQPIIDLTHETLPGLSALGLNVTIGDLLKASGGPGADLIKALNAVDYINQASGDLAASGTLPLGSFSLVDPSNLGASLGEVLGGAGDLVQTAIGAIPGAQDLINQFDSDLGGGGTWLADLESGTSNGTSSMLDFPLLDDPVNCAWQFLIGNNPHLFDLTVPDVDVPLAATFSLGFPDVLEVDLSAGLDFTFSLKAGYDTTGLRSFLGLGGDPSLQGDPAALLYGFFIDNTPSDRTDDQGHHYTHYATGVDLQGFAQANVSLLGANLTGGLYATGNLHLNPALDDSNNLVHLNDIIQTIAGPNPFSVFQASGILYASLDFFYGLDVPFGPSIKLFSYNIANSVIYDFTSDQNPPSVPQGSSDDNNVVYVHMSDISSNVVVESGTRTHTDGRVDYGILVDYGGVYQFYSIATLDSHGNQIPETYDRPYNLIATDMPKDSSGNYRAAHGNHNIDIDASVKDYLHYANETGIDAILIGGDGDDQFTYDGGGTAMLVGGGGNNTLSGARIEYGGGTGSDWQDNWSGYSSTAVPMDIAAELNSQEDSTLGGQDYLTGTPQADLLIGGAGTNFFVGLGGSDTIVGGPNADTLEVDNALQASAGTVSFQGNSSSTLFYAGGASATGTNSPDNIEVFRGAIDFAGQTGVKEGSKVNVLGIFGNLAVSSPGGSVTIDDQSSTILQHLSVTFPANGGSNTVTVKGSSGNDIFTPSAYQVTEHNQVRRGAYVSVQYPFSTLQIDLTNFPDSDQLVLDGGSGSNQYHINPQAYQNLNISIQDTGTQPGDQNTLAADFSAFPNTLGLGQLEVDDSSVTYTGSDFTGPNLSALALAMTRLRIASAFSVLNFETVAPALAGLSAAETSLVTRNEAFTNFQLMGDTINFDSTVQNLTATTGANDNTITIDRPSSVLNATIHGGSGVNEFDINHNFGHTILYGGNAGDTYNINNAVGLVEMHGGSGNDIFNINSPTANYSADGGAGNDTYNITLPDLTGRFQSFQYNIQDSGPATDSDTLHIIAPAAAYPVETRSYTLTGSTTIFDFSAPGQPGLSTVNTGTISTVTSDPIFQYPDFATINYTNIENVIVDTAPTAASNLISNYVYVSSTAAGTPVTVNTAVGATTVVLGSDNHNLDNLLAAVTVNGSANGTTAVQVHDENASSHEYDLGASTLSRTVPATNSSSGAGGGGNAAMPLTFNNIQSLSLFAGAHANTFNVTAPAVPYTLIDDVNEGQQRNNAFDTASINGLAGQLELRVGTGSTVPTLRGPLLPPKACRFPAICSSPIRTWARRTRSSLIGGMGQLPRRSICPQGPCRRRSATPMPRKAAIP